MSNAEINIDRVLDLTEAVCDETASTNDFAELDAILLSDGQSRFQYLDYYRMHVSLRLQLRARRAAQRVHQHIDSEASLPASVTLNAATDQIFSSIPSSFLGSAIHGMIGYLPEGMPFACLVATIVLGVGILAASLIHVSHAVNNAEQMPSVVKNTLTPTSKTEKVGQITGMVDCQWADPNTAAIHGGNVLLGRKFALASGLLEITYATGATVILQGPVTYEVESRDGGFLSVGKLAARLEKKPAAISGQRSAKTDLNTPAVRPQSPAPLFSVRTPTATVTDLGTEFGVEVSKDGATEAQVFVGAVKIRSLHDGNSGKGEQVVYAGNAVRVNSTGNRLVTMQSAERRFIRKLQSDPLTYMKAVLADRPLFYWTFDESDGPAFEQVRHTGSQALLAKGNVSRCTHAVIGSGLALGRAADFTRVGGCFMSGMMQQGQMPGAWAIEFWVQAADDRNNQPMQYLLNAGVDMPYGPHNPAVVIESDADAKNELRFYGYGTGHARGGMIAADRRWHHVLFAFYGNGSWFGVALRTDVVVDGRLKTIDHGGFTSSFDLNRLIIGAADEDAASRFHGRIDEIAIYDLSGLSVKQIESRLRDIARRHIQAARPYDFQTTIPQRNSGEGR